MSFNHESARERMNRIFDEIEAERLGIVPPKPEPTIAEIQAQNRKARIDRLSAMDPAMFVGNVTKMLEDGAFKTPWEIILANQCKRLFSLGKIPGQLNSEITVYRNFVSALITDLEHATELAREQDNHHHYKVFADRVRKLLEKL